MKDGVLEEFLAERYRGWQSELGTRIMDGQVGFEELQQHALKHGEPELQSGRQEMLENILNEYV